MPQAITMLAPDAPKHRARWRCAAMLLVLLVASCFTAFSGNGVSLPLDEHDTLVARSAEEMIDRNQFLVPYINGEVRLKKPPLQNWLALATHYVFDPDTHGIIDPWEARF